MMIASILYIFSFSSMKTGSSKSDSFSSSGSQQTYGDRFVEALIMEAERDKDIVAVHAGMGMEKSLHLFREKFPDRFFEVGMAEQHAVTFSAGLACGGLKPFCIIPSAFLQRAYDQVLSLSLPPPSKPCVPLCVVFIIRSVSFTSGNSNVYHPQYNLKV